MNSKVDRGTYALILYLPRSKRIRVGALGEFAFPGGTYVYLGSALGGLDARVARHLKKDKRRFWHIDYFLEHARILDVWSQVGNRRFECRWARAALGLENAEIPAPRFGASDCRCASHLVYLAGKRPP